MRVRGPFVIMTVVGLVAAIPVGSARAGGNWLDVRRDGARWEVWAGPFVPGTTLEVRGTVYERGAKAERLRDAGPYYAWIAPQRARVDVNGLPAGAIRLSVFDLRWTSEGFAVARTSFSLPQLASGRYTIAVCNDPCGLSGFGDYVQGWTSVVQSAEAVTLQHQKDRLSEKLYRSRRDAVAARRDADRLQAHLNDSQASRAVLAAGVAALTEELGSARRRAQAAVITSGRPFVDPWVGLVLALALLGLAVTLAIRRRGGRIAIPDTPEELVRRDEMERRSLNR